MYVFRPEVDIDCLPSLVPLVVEAGPLSPEHTLVKPAGRLVKLLGSAWLPPLHQSYRWTTACPFVRSAW